MSKRTHNKHMQSAFSKVFSGSLRGYMKKQSELLTPVLSAWVIAAMVLSVAGIASFGAFAAGTYSIQIDTINGNPPSTACFVGSIDLVGRGSVVNGQGGSYSVQVDWGDGIIQNSISISTTNISQNGRTFDFSYSATHIASTTSTTITARLYHSQEYGNDASVAISTPVSVCIVPPSNAVLNVKKLVTNDNGGTATSSNFTLHLKSATTTTDVAGSPFSGSSGGTDFVLTPGTYTVSENTLAGYAQMGISGGCAIDGTITVAAGSNYSCTITNDDNIPLPPGTITVHKNVVGVDGSTDVSDAHSFTVRLNGGSPSAIDEGLEALYGGLAPGTYIVSEDADANYTLVSITPDGDGGAAGAQVTVASNTNTNVYIVNKQLPATVTVKKNVVAPDGTTDVADNHGFSVTVNGETKSVNENADALFTVDPGTYTAIESADTAYDFVGDTGSATVGSNGSATITIINKQHQGMLQVIKHVVNHGIGTSEASDFTMSVSGTNVSSASFPGDELGTAVTMDPGTYSVTESGPAGYAESLGSNCTSAFMPSGGDKTCTVTNSDLPDGQGAITVVKNVIKDNGGTASASNFSLYINETSVANGAANFFGPGTYTVSESAFSGYTQTGYRLYGQRQPDGWQYRES